MTELRCFPYRFGRIPSPRRALIDTIGLHAVEIALDPLRDFLCAPDATSQQLARDPAHQHRDRIEDQDDLDHLVGHLRSPSTRSNTITGISAHEQ